MNLKTSAGALAVVAVMGLAVLSGGILAHTASAGAVVTLTSQQGQTAQATATAVPGTPKATAVPGAPSAPFPGAKGGPGFGGKMFGGRGFGHHGPGGFGHLSGPYSTEGATRTISMTTDLINLVKGDLAYATGKMDTGTVQNWINQADALLRSAQSAAGSSQFGRAVETAGAATGLAGAAHLLMAQSLGADQLPSYTQRPMKGGMGKEGRHGMAPGAVTGVTQAQASRHLAGLYNGILAQQAQLGRAGNTGDANNYLTAAKDYYRTAYDAYQAGKYDDAFKAASVSQALLGVVDGLVRAASAPNTQDAPIQVPAPNF